MTVWIRGEELRAAILSDELTAGWMSDLWAEEVASRLSELVERKVGERQRHAERAAAAVLSRVIMDLPTPPDGTWRGAVYAAVINAVPEVLRASGPRQEPHEEAEPGTPIAAGSCPACGVALSIEHGDDSGEVAIIASPARQEGPPPSPIVTDEEVATFKAVARERDVLDDPYAWHRALEHFLRGRASPSGAAPTEKQASG